MLIWRPVSRAINDKQLSMCGLVSIQRVSKWITWHHILRVIQNILWNQVKLMPHCVFRKIRMELDRYENFHGYFCNLDFGIVFHISETNHNL